MASRGRNRETPHSRSSPFPLHPACSSPIPCEPWMEMLPGGPADWDRLLKSLRAGADFIKRCHASEEVEKRSGEQQKRFQEKT